MLLILPSEFQIDNLLRRVEQASPVTDRFSIWLLPKALIVVHILIMQSRLLFSCSYGCTYALYDKGSLRIGAIVQ